MFLRLALAASALWIAACSETESRPDILAVPVALFPDDPGRERLGALRYRGGLVLSSAHPGFGGWSAIDVSADGARLLAVSDRGAWMTADFTFNQDGRLTGLSNAAITPMLDSEGRAWTGAAADAEGLAPLGGGAFAVSFERDHRILRYQLGEDWAAIETARAAPLPAPPGADRLRNNAGLEALAATQDVLWAGVEYPIVEGQPYTLWRFDRGNLDAAPRAFALNVSSGFGLTALASDGAQGLWIVERFYARDIGNRIRVGRISAAALETVSGPITPDLVAEVSPDMTVDNIEAIAMVEIAGETRLFLMSDDNFNQAQRTLLLSFVLQAG